MLAPPRSPQRRSALAALLLLTALVSLGPATSALAAPGHTVTGVVFPDGAGAISATSRSAGASCSGATCVVADGARVLLTARPKWPGVTFENTWSANCT